MNILQKVFLSIRHKRLIKQSQKHQKKKELKMLLQNPNSALEVKNNCICLCPLRQKDKEQMLLWLIDQYERHKILTSMTDELADEPEKQVDLVL